MYDWTKLTNNHFNDFNIEDLSLWVYLPSYQVDNFVKFIEFSSEKEIEKQELLVSICNSFHEVNALEINALNVRNIELNKDNPSIRISEMIAISTYNAGIFDSDDDNAIKKTGIDDDIGLAKSIFQGTWGQRSGEYIIAYCKRDGFGAFSGTVITNKRIIAIGKNNFSIDIIDINSVKRGFASVSVNDRKLPTCDIACEYLLKSLIECNSIPFTFIAKMDSDNRKKGILVFSRDMKK